MQCFRLWSKLFDTVLQSCVSQKKLNFPSLSLSIFFHSQFFDNQRHVYMHSCLHACNVILLSLHSALTRLLRNEEEDREREERGRETRHKTKTDRDLVACLTLLCDISIYDTLAEFFLMSNRKYKPQCRR